MEKYTVSEWIRFTLKKWWVIVLSIIVFAALMGLPRMIQTGVPGESYRYYYYYSQLVEFKNHAMAESSEQITSEGAIEADNYVDYSELFYRRVMLSDFREALNKKYDMSRIVPDWSNYGFAQQIDWIIKAFSVSHVRNTPHYEVTLQISAAFSESDDGYIRKNVKEMFEDFIQYAEKCSRVYSPDSSIVRLKDADFSYEYTLDDAGGIFGLKYFVVGGLLGAVLGLFIAAVLFLSSKRIVSKTMFQQLYDIDAVDSKNMAYALCCYMIRQAQSSGNHCLAIVSTDRAVKHLPAVLSEFARCGYKTGVANLSQRPIELGHDVSAISVEVCASMRLPGHAAEMDEAARNFDYLIVCADSPVDNEASIEAMTRCACTVLVEKVGVSLKGDVKGAIESLKKANEAYPVCIAWDK